MNHMDLEKLVLELKEHHWRSLDYPNPFEVLNIVHRETIHSEFLAWLLNPLGTHKLGDRFLRKFLITLNDLQDTTTSKITLNHFEHTTIYRELGKIDITIIDPHAKVVIIIENKIHSTQSENQLQSYKEQMNKQYPYYQIRYVFLTLYYEKAQDEGWVLMNYQHILEILKAIKNEDSSLINDQSLINDYMQLFRKELRMEKDLLNRCLDIYQDNKDAIELLVKAREENITCYYEEIRKYIDAQDNLKFVIGDRNNHKFNFVTQYQQDNAFIVDKRDNKFGNPYGFMYEVQKTDAGFNVIGTLGSDKTVRLSQLKEYAITNGILISGKDDLAGWAIVFKGKTMLVSETDLLVSIDNYRTQLIENLKTVLQEIDIFERNYKEFIEHANR